MMIGIVITGHGQFAGGLLSAAEVIAGAQENVRAINFLSGDASEKLHDAIARAVEEMRCESVVFLTDIAGGTPFNQSVLVAAKAACECRVFSGANVPLLLEAVFGRARGSVGELSAALLASEQAKVQLYTEKKKSRAEGAGGI